MFLHAHRITLMILAIRLLQARQRYVSIVKSVMAPNLLTANKTRVEKVFMLSVVCCGSKNLRIVYLLRSLDIFWRAFPLPWSLNQWTGPVGNSVPPPIRSKQPCIPKNGDYDGIWEATRSFKSLRSIRRQLTQGPHKKAPKSTSKRRRWWHPSVPSLDVLGCWNGTILWDRLINHQHSIEKMSNLVEPLGTSKH